MSELVPHDQIEGIVGAERHPTMHVGRAVSAEQQVYILHSQECLDSGIDLRDCMFSLTLDKGINLHEWEGSEDQAVTLRIRKGRLIPFPFRGRRSR